MQFRELSVCCLLLCGPCALLAQVPGPVNSRQAAARPTAQSARYSTSARLLDSNDGLAVLGAALETRHRSQLRSDCSHLVHAIYEKAGFPYKYQSSSDLFAGDDEFQRVPQPQAGDLIVWPGHAGIVVNPAQHTFYSALRSGFGVQPYDSVYWKGRGRPRFLRYIKARPNPVVAARHVAGLKSTGLRSSTAVEHDRVNSADSVPEDSSLESTQVRDDSTEPKALPAALVISSSHPKSDQVSASLAEHFRGSEESTPAKDGVKVHSPIVTFDRFEVQKVLVKGDIGWVQIRFRGFLVLGGRDPEKGKPRDTQRFMLRRVAPDSWEMILPSDAIYLPHDVAVRSLAHQLALLTDGPDAAAKADQKVQLARWLDALLEHR